jgi:Membrane-bound metallopeptidase
MKKIKSGICMCLCFLLLLSPVATCLASPATYQISEAELTQLEQSLIEQENYLLEALRLLDEQNLELSELREHLEIALSEVQESRAEIQRLRQELEKALESIERANQLFREYEKEVERTQSRLTRQRNLFLFLGLAAVGYGVGK